MLLIVLNQTRTGLRAANNPNNAPTMKANYLDVKRGALGPSKVQLSALGLFAFSLIFLGGSARQDMVQLAALYPVAALCLIPVLYQLKWEGLKQYRALAFLLLLLILWTIIQLVPLPPEFWSMLPGRSALAALDTELSQGQIWRPISMAPELGQASLFGMVVPLAALLLAATCCLRKSALLGLVAAIGVANVVMGFAQIAGGGGASLRIYRINSLGGPSGVFANENHSAAFLAIILLVIARLVIWSVETKRAGWRLYAGVFALGLTLLSILVHGSRSGIVMGLFASLAILLMFWRALPSFGLEAGRKSKRSKKGAGSFQKWGRYAFGALGIVFVGLIVVFLSMERVPGFADLSGKDTLDDLRWKLIDPLWVMAKEFWLVGVGFGSFAPAYMQFEPTSLALPSYVNQAHNDFLQLIIEGGVIAVLLFTALIIFIGRSISKIAGSKGLLSPLPIFWMAAIGIVAAASLIDYPVRTPLFQACMIWLLCVLTLDAKAKDRREL